MPPTGRPAERKLEAVERAMRVLDAFLDIPGEAGTNELAAVWANRRREMIGCAIYHPHR